jgi:hypothetical protein
MAGRMDAAWASPVSAWMAVSREQNDHPLGSRIGRALVRRDLDATAAPFDRSIGGRLAHHDLQGLVTPHRLRR